MKCYVSVRGLISVKKQNKNQGVKILITSRIVPPKKIIAREKKTATTTVKRNGDWLTTIEEAEAENHVTKGATFYKASYYFVLVTTIEAQSTESVETSVFSISISVVKPKSV